MSEQRPSKPLVSYGKLIYQAPAPVKVTANGGEALLRRGDTLTVVFNQARPEGLALAFDWDVDDPTLIQCYQTNEARGGTVDVWYERNGS